MPTSTSTPTMASRRRTPAPATSPAARSAGCSARSTETPAAGQRRLSLPNGNRGDGGPGRSRLDVGLGSSSCVWGGKRVPRVARDSQPPGHYGRGRTDWGQARRDHLTMLAPSRSTPAVAALHEAVSTYSGYSFSSPDQAVRRHPGAQPPTPRAALNAVPHRSTRLTLSHRRRLAAHHLHRLSRLLRLHQAVELALAQV